MSVNNAPHLIDREAGANLSAKQYFILQPDGSAEEEVKLAGAATNQLIGVLQNDPVEGDVAQIAIGGTAKVIAGGSISFGDYITTDANGKAVTTTTTANKVIGQALQDASASDIFEMHIVKFVYP